MKSFNVCAGWLQDNPIIGRCLIDRARGNEIISFQYSADWLRSHPSFYLGPDIQSVTGIQYPNPGHKFGFISDSSPDRWGERLLNRRETIQAKKENRTPRTLMASDLLLGIDDEGRMGGLRFQDSNGRFLSHDSEYPIPAITDLRKLQRMIIEFENNSPGIEKVFEDLCHPGSSLGGARPKTNVYDVDGSLWLAKFPSNKDTYDVGAFELMTHDMASACGISVPPAQAIYIKGSGTVYLVKRFDRTTGSGRKHFASAMTMLGEYDDSTHKSSYLDIISTVEEHSSSPKNDLLELWKRIAFSVCVSNSDDHLRNHGFIFNGDHIALAPAYDINPSVERHQLSLNIDYYSDEINLDLVIGVAEYFRIGTDFARSTINEMQNTIKKILATHESKYNISKADFEYIKPAFNQVFQVL